MWKKPRFFKEPNIVEFLNRLDFIYQIKGDTITAEDVLKEFNTLSITEKATVILSIIRHKDFKIEENPDVYNDVCLINMKKNFFGSLCIAMIILALAAFSFSINDPDSSINNFITSFINQVKFVFEFIFTL